jgi:hypothetical protein
LFKVSLAVAKSGFTGLRWARESQLRPQLPAKGTKALNEYEEN